MHDRRFDDLARRLGAIGKARTDRRTFLQAFGLAAASTLTTSAGIAIAQDSSATPAPPTVTSRQPGGKSIDDTAFDLNIDPETIFRFVADEVRYEPYAGVLRGAKGTLWGRAGNSADKAMLLAALLKSALVEVRFAVGTLDDATAAKVLAASAIDAATAKAHAEKVMAITSPSTSDVDASSLTPEQQAAIDKFPQSREEILTKAKELRAEGVATITSALADAGITIAAPSADLPDLERTQHVWVQYASGTDWIDLDPTLPHAKSGDTLTTAEQTLTELPDEIFHNVQFRIISETVSGRTPTRGDLLTYQATSQELVGVPLTVMHAKPDALKGIGVTIAAAFGGATQWVPYLIVGDKPVRGNPMAFKTTGGSDATPDPSLGGAAGALGGDSASDGEGDTLAAWLAIDITTPDGQTRHAERVIFDRVDPQDRAARTFDPTALPPIELTPAGDPFGDVYLPLMSTTSLAVVGYQVPGDYFAQDFSVSDPRGDLATVAYAHHFVRTAIEIDQASDIGFRFFPNEPNVTGYSLIPTQIEASADGRLIATIDMFHQAYGATSLDGSASTDNPGIVTGVLGHVAERAIFGELVSVMPTPEGKVFLSVGRVFEEAKRNNIPLVTLQPGTTPANIDVSPRAAGLIKDALDTGFVVIVPEKGVPLDGTPYSGWWQVNPETGETFDRMETGGSQDLAEETVLLGELLEGIHKLASLGFCVLGVFFGAVAVLDAIAGFGTEAVKFGVGQLPFSGAMCVAAFA
jgi:large repetitive protein